MNAESRPKSSPGGRAKLAQHFAKILRILAWLLIAAAGAIAIAAIALKIQETLLRHLPDSHFSVSNESAVPRCRAPVWFHALGKLQTFASCLMAAFREIFDESAYARFLSRTQAGISRESYAEFLRENELAKAFRPR